MNAEMNPKILAQVIAGRVLLGRPTFAVASRTAQHSFSAPAPLDRDLPMTQSLPWPSNCAKQTCCLKVLHSHGVTNKASLELPLSRTMPPT